MQRRSSPAPDDETSRKRARTIHRDDSAVCKAQATTAHGSRKEEKARLRCSICSEQEFEGVSAALRCSWSHTVQCQTRYPSSRWRSSHGGIPSIHFRAQNAKDAQALNAKFTSLTKDSACNGTFSSLHNPACSITNCSFIADGESACVEGGFAQCVGGKFTIMPCSGGTQCFALPLVNKPGTSLTCDTKSDADARITQAGGSGDINGN